MFEEEVQLQMHVRDVEYNEQNCERVSGTLFITNFRLIFVPDNETLSNTQVSVHFMSNNDR